MPYQLNELNLTVWRFSFKGNQNVNNKKINSKKYFCQLGELRAFVLEKCRVIANWKFVIFHHNNARSQVSLNVPQYLLEFRCNIFSHPAYSPDIGLSEKHICRELQNSINGKKFQSFEAIKNHANKFINGKPTNFFTDL